MCLLVAHFAAVSLWISFLAKCKTFNVVSIGRVSLFNSDGKSHSCRTYLHDVRTMRPIQKNIYLPVQYFSVKILIYSATLTDFLNANLIIFLRDIKEKKVFFMKQPVKYAVIGSGQVTCHWYWRCNKVYDTSDLHSSMLAPYYYFIILLFIIRLLMHIESFTKRRT